MKNWKNIFSDFSHKKFVIMFLPIPSIILFLFFCCLMSTATYENGENIGIAMWMFGVMICVIFLFSHVI
jgi:predicted transporter